MASLLPLAFVAFLVGAAGLALPSSGAAGPPSDGSSSHSLHYFYTAVTESSPGLPQFLNLGYVDDILFVHYDASTRRAVPRIPWVEKVEKTDPQYWDWETQGAQSTERVFRTNLVIAQHRYNQSGGFHTLQERLGCELRRDGSTGGYVQFAYDGRDYLSFDLETLTWTAADGPAQITKRKWDADSEINQYLKAYLEEACMKELRRHLDFGKEMLKRTEPPVGKVTRKAVGDGQETLICQAHGFYPKEIDATWKKGEDVMDHETFRRDVAPNSDGTYHTWLGIDIDPKERDLYRCHLDHASLPEPLVLAFEEPPGANVGLFVGAILGVVAVLLVAGLAVFFPRNRQKKADCEAASISDNSSATFLRDESPPLVPSTTSEEEKRKIQLHRTKKEMKASPSIPIATSLASKGEKKGEMKLRQA